MLLYLTKDSSMLVKDNRISILLISDVSHFRNRASCVALSVLNNNTMPRNSEPEMVIKSFDEGGTTGGTGGVARGSVEAA